MLHIPNAEKSATSSCGVECNRPDFVDASGISQTGQGFASFLLAAPWSDLDVDLRRKVGEVIAHRTENGVLDICSGSLVFRV